MDEFVKALGADVVIPLHPPGRALGASEMLTLRSWFDARRRSLAATRTQTARPRD